MTPARYIRQIVLGLSQEQLAERLNVTQATVSRWEASGSIPHRHQPAIRRLAPPDHWSDALFWEVPNEFADAAGGEAA